MGLRAELTNLLWQNDLLASHPCSHPECQELYAKVKKGEPLPPDVWQVGEKAEFVRLGKSELTQEELQTLIQLRQLKTMNSIRSMVLFFVVLAVISLIITFLSFIS